jgi:hypothetical protein
MTEEAWFANLALASTISSSSSKQVTIAAIDDDDSGIESDSNNSRGGPTLNMAFNSI